MPLHQCGQLHGSWTQRSGYILQTAIMGKWLLSDLVIWKIIKKRNFSKDKYAPTGKVVKSKFSLFYLCFSLTFHTKRIEQRQYFTLSSTWYLTETSTMQINSERGELWKRWGVLRATDFETSVVSQEQGENHFWDKRKPFDLGSESAWTLEVSVPLTTKSERKPKPAWPFSNLAPLNKKKEKWIDGKVLSPLLSVRLSRSRLLSFSLALITVTFNYITS